MKKMPVSAVSGIAVLILVGLTACGAPEPDPATDAEPTVSAEAAALHEAARQGDVAQLRRLVEEEGVPIDAGDRYGASALMMAADRGHLEAVSYLLGAQNPNGSWGEYSREKYGAYVDQRLYLHTTTVAIRALIQAFSDRWS
jgi:hypothetical protein